MKKPKPALHTISIDLLVRDHGAVMREKLRQNIADGASFSCMSCGKPLTAATLDALLFLGPDGEVHTLGCHEGCKDALRLAAAPIYGPRAH